MESEGVTTPPVDTTTSVAAASATEVSAEPAPAPPGSPPRRREPLREVPPAVPLIEGIKARVAKFNKPQLRRPKLRKPILSPPAAPAEPAPTRRSSPTRRDRRYAKAAQVRRTQRVIRRVDPWSVLKISVVFYICLWIVVLTAGVLLWAAAASAGAIENVEDFIKELGGFKEFAFEPAEMLRACLLGGFVLVVAGSLANVFITVVFNLISDLVGGVRVTVLEEERPRRPSR